MKPANLASRPALALRSLMRKCATAGLLALVCASGIAMAQADRSPSYIETQQAGVNARIEVLGQAFTSPYPIGADQSRIMLYSTSQVRLSGATSVFIDGRYHTSLVPGAWSALCYRTGNAEIGARQMEVGNRPKDLVDSITALQLQGGQTHYLRVQEDQGRPVLQTVPAAQAHQEMSQFKEQVHTVSRVAQACREGVAPIPASQLANAPHRITLPADTLFAFNRSDAAGMTGPGMSAMDNLLAMLKADFSRVESMHVIGHADPLGNAQANERLATERSRTVATYLQMRGLSSMSISTEGRGDRDPVISTCSRQITARSIACNQPNRRVVVEVLGIRR